MASSETNQQKEASDAGIVAKVDSVAVKAPPFWPNDPEMYFFRLEAQFALAKVTKESTKFNIVVQALDPIQIREIRPVLQNPPRGREYETVKAALTEAFGPTQEQKDQELFSLTTLGDRSACSMLRQIQYLTTSLEQVQTALLLSVVPADVRQMASSQQFANAEELAKAIDRILHRKMMSQGLAQGISSVEAEVAAVSRQPGKEKKKKKTEGFVCWRHKKYGDQAHTCEKGCMLEFTMAAKKNSSGN